MHRIIVIGAGQIGSRHLQALALVSEEWQIAVVDPSQDSLRIARARVEEISGRKIQISYTTEMPTKENYALAIIATAAMHRFDVFLQLVESNTVNFIIFEKVLFQTITHIDKTEMLLKKYGIKAWVNCARRSNAGYRALQQILKTAAPISMRVSGNNFGLACNGIHFLDLFAFLINQPAIDKLTQQFSPEYFTTKRPGCYEVAGILTAIAGDNKLEIMCSNYGDSISVKVEIVTNDSRFTIDEVNRKLSELNLSTMQVNNSEFILQPQSRMTHIVSGDILSSGQCTLPTYAESAALHRHYIRLFHDYFNTNSPGKFSACPIS